MAVSRRPQAQVGPALTGERVPMFRKPHGCGGMGSGQAGGCIREDCSPLEPQASLPPQHSVRVLERPPGS